MPRAILKKGLIYPIEPLPADWQDGTGLAVEKLDDASGDLDKAANRWMDEVEALAAKIPDGEDEKLTSAIVEIRRQSKELARKGKC
jgi:hypothetical protein